MKGLALIANISIFVFGMVSCSYVSPTVNVPSKPTPSAYISWNTNPNGRIALATSCCDGPLVEELVRPYIPEAQVWGDGRFLWSEQHDDGTRQVFAAQLSVGEMTGLLQKIDDSGFFDWDEQYQDEPVVDAASQCLTVTLAGQSKMVCATHGGAPEAFYTLFDWLSHGAGKNGTPYRPATAFLTGFQLEGANGPLPGPDLIWPETLSHAPVNEAIDGFWLDEGEALQALWEATNRNLHHMPVIEHGGNRYRIILQVPGVSWIEP